jgi:hypothetical protein
VVVQMQIRTADRRGCDLNDGIPGIYDSGPGRYLPGRHACRAKSVRAFGKLLKIGV